MSRCSGFQCVSVLTEILIFLVSPDRFHMISFLRRPSWLRVVVTQACLWGAALCDLCTGSSGKWSNDWILKQDGYPFSHNWLVVSNIFSFTPIWGGNDPIWLIFFKGLKPPTSYPFSHNHGSGKLLFLNGSLLLLTVQKSGDHHLGCKIPCR